MCGVVGYYGPAGSAAVLEAMNACQVHRGPDDGGTFVDGPFGTGHRRLAIIDTHHGVQPMTTADGRFTISYNGEVYNYLDLKKELEQLGRSFRTTSDTEVVLTAFLEWGAEAFDRFNGMWGLAIWDAQEQRVTLSRDHFGIKPLYVAQVGETVLFSSEIKPLLASGIYRKAPNERSLYRYLRFRAHEDTHETFFDGIERLGPGETMTIDAAGVRRRPFTRLKEELAELANEQRPYDDAFAREYRARLVESIRLRLQSEVPVGTSLSGGLDSSAVAMVINQLLTEGESTAADSVGARQNTFSAVFPGSTNDEERYVDAVLEKCSGQVDAHKIKPSAADFAADLHDFIRTQEEPTISSGPYAQYQVMREATKHVTVLLDGQGADEMMAGYIPYYFVYLRQLSGAARVKELAKSADVIYRLGRFRLQGMVRGRKATPISALMDTDFAQRYSGETFSVENSNLRKRLIEDIFHNSLPSLLRYEDRNTMRFSLEGRVPFMDKEVLKFLFSLSDDSIIKDGWNKRILRDATRGLLPESINRRRNKIGFTTPESQWFKEMKDYFREVFASESFGGRSYFNQAEVLAAFDGWLDGTNASDSMQFWRVLNVELWLREFFDDDSARGESVVTATAAGK